MFRIASTLVVGAALVAAPLSASAASAATPSPHTSAPSHSVRSVPQLDSVTISGDQVRKARLILRGADDRASFTIVNKTNGEEVSGSVGSAGIVSASIPIEAGQLNRLEVHVTQTEGPDVTVPVDADDRRADLTPRVEVVEDAAAKTARVTVSGRPKSLVYVRDAAGRPVAGGLSDAAGRFETTLPLPSGRVTYTVEQKVDAAWSEKVPFTLSENAGAPVETAPGAAVQSVSGSKALVAVTGIPGAVARVASAGGEAVRRLGSTGVGQVAVPVTPGADEALTVTQTLDGTTSKAAKVEAVPSPAVETVWRGRDSAILKVARQSGDLAIRDGAGKLVAQRTMEQDDDIFVRVPLTGAGVNHFTAVRTSTTDLAGSSTPTAIDVAPGADSLATPTAGIIGSANSPFIRVVGQPGALIVAHEVGTSAAFDIVETLGGGGSGVVRNLTRGATYEVTLKSGSTVSETVTVVVP